MSVLVAAQGGARRFVLFSRISSKTYKLKKKQEKNRKSKCVSVILWVFFKKFIFEPTHKLLGSYIPSEYRKGFRCVKHQQKTQIKHLILKRFGNEYMKRKKNRNEIKHINYMCFSRI